MRQKHVENVCRGLNSRTKANTINSFLTTFTPDSLAEQRRNLYVIYNNNKKKKNATMKTKYTRLISYNEATIYKIGIPLQVILWQIARKISIFARFQPTLTRLTIDTLSKNINSIIHTFAPRQKAIAWLEIPLYNLMATSPIPIPVSNGIQAQALHINGLTPHTNQHFTYLVTCNPCIRVHDIKEIIKDILHFVSDNPDASYDRLLFSEVNLA